MTSQYQECLQLFENLASKVQDSSKAIESSTEKVSKVSSFGFDGLDLKKSVEAIQAGISKLKAEVKITKESIGKVSGNAYFSPSQTNEIYGKWDQMVEEAKEFEPSLQEVEQNLKGTNFWAGLVYGFEQIYKETRKMLVNLSRPILKQAQKMINQAKKGLQLREWED